MQTADAVPGAGGDQLNAQFAGSQRDRVPLASRWAPQICRGQRRSGRHRCPAAWVDSGPQYSVRGPETGQGAAGAECAVHGGGVLPTQRTGNVYERELGRVSRGESMLTVGVQRVQDALPVLGGSAPPGGWR